jgi:polyphosphate glucokinase
MSTKQTTSKSTPAKTAAPRKAVPKKAVPKTSAPKTSAPKTSAPKASPPKVGHGPHTLAIDIGGTGLKASVLDSNGTMTTERVRVDTPHPCSPKLLVEGLVGLARDLQSRGQRWDRVSVGFPGLIRHGIIHTAPNLGTQAFAGFNLAKALEEKLGAPVRAVNDADMQGLAAIKGEGVEFVITLGTGFGTALFNDGRLQVHLEVAHLPFRKGETYDQQLGDRARKAIGTKKWLKRVHEAIAHMYTLTNFDHLAIGGGNAKHLEGEKLAKNISLVDNSAGILGGIRLWDNSVGDV